MMFIIAVVVTTGRFLSLPPMSSNLIRSRGDFLFVVMKQAF